MTLDQLEAFVATVEHNGFKPAARALGKHSSTISTLVATLEDIVGFDLFERLPRSLVITDKGQELYNEAKAVLREADMFQSKADSLQQGIKGKLTLAIDNSVADDKVLQSIQTVSAQYPSVKIRLLSGDTLQVRTWVLSGRADFGISLATHTNLAGLDVQRAYSFKIAVIVPLSWDSDTYTSLTALRSELQLCYSFFTELGMEDAHIVSYRTLECNDGRQMIDLVEKGIGYAIVPEYLAQKAIQEKRVKQLELAEQKPALWYTNQIKLTDSTLDPVGKRFFKEFGQIVDK
ncbi:LysR family transcriptional regulator [Vibrio tubiashii]|uniref:LysR family transcriptional regulator n=1 Tax=Vibrio tubiashii ATCC 19109 TaxID=1051646 RepID=F9T517_9VIBR|nr:LysR family transcriptional regulator [Vibrio tubiashii]AIW16711.1 LysR family transcriptional regulator [Vibrio tubiashii ATCC 19109]EGU55504.1 LysR family transcriptional regulator [Vibrio tubiashii ATCC 19109]EIF02057.1 LysR family transcriptional regulator [Vibrio tubiashii NCIMB 1337 = ATCC 19106]